MVDTIREISEQVINVFQSLGQTIRVEDIIDILIITFVIYRTLSIMQRTSASSVIQGLLIILGIALIANWFQMNILSYLLEQVLRLGLVVIIVLFQPEIRKLIERMGTTRLNTLFRRRGKYEDIEEAIGHVVESCAAMAKTKTGALIVFERKVGLNDFAVSGVGINADISSELIQSIFFENTPMHDGALIIREDKVLAASCMLPLSTNYNISKELGMRHRAGLGISERSDAVVVLVSEETGHISVAIDGMLKRNLDVETLVSILVNEVLLSEETGKRAKKKSKADREAQKISKLS